VSLATIVATRPARPWRFVSMRKSQIKAFERALPILPMGFGYVEGITHDYRRHGTTTLFAAVNVLDGAV